MNMTLTPRRGSFAGLDEEKEVWEGRTEPDAGSQGWHKTTWLWLRGDGQEAELQWQPLDRGSTGWKVADSTQESEGKQESSADAPLSNNTSSSTVQEKQNYYLQRASPCFALNHQICLHYWPPTACYSHSCKSSMSCCEETKLQGKVCSWISPAIVTLLSTPWGFPGKIEQSSTLSEKLFSALRGFTKMQRQNIYATHGLGLSWPTVAWLLGIKMREMGISGNAGGENRSPVDLRYIKAKQLPKDNYRLKQTHVINTNIPCITCLYKQTWFLILFRRLLSFLEEFLLLDNSYLNVI